MAERNILTQLFFSNHGIKWGNISQNFIVVSDFYAQNQSKNFSFRPSDPILGKGEFFSEFGHFHLFSGKKNLFARAEAPSSHLNFSILTPSLAAGPTIVCGEKKSDAAFRISIRGMLHNACYRLNTFCRAFHRLVISVGHVVLMRRQRAFRRYPSTNASKKWAAPELRVLRL